MDVTLPFPGSWPLVRKNLPALLGAGFGAIASTYAAGRRAYKQIDADRRAAPFATSTKSTYAPRPRPMPIKSYRPMRRMRKMYRRSYRRSKGMVANAVKRIVRSTGPSTLTISAGTTAFLSGNVLLSAVQTTDLTSIYRLYRIRKVVVHLVPRVDAANSGLVNNFQVMVAAACDPESSTTPVTIAAITAYDNSYQKWLTSGGHFTYTFSPKVTNSVDVSGTATAAGSYALNPWLRLDATGITVPHLSLKLGIQSGNITTINFDYYFDIHFDTRGIA